MPMSPHAICARLLLEITKRVSAAVLKSHEFGSHADLVMLCTAVWIGQVEKRPMTAGKLAAYVGIPRPTVVRKLAALRDAGVARECGKGRWTLTLPEDDPEEFTALSLANSASINRAFNKLSKMDNRAVAPGEA